MVSEWPTTSICAYLANFAAVEDGEPLDWSKLGMIRRARTRKRIIALAVQWRVPWRWWCRS